MKAALLCALMLLCGCARAGGQAAQPTPAPQTVDSAAAAQLAALDVSGLQRAADALAGEGLFDVRAVLDRLRSGETLDAQALLERLLSLMAALLRGRAGFMLTLVACAVLAGMAGRLCGEGGGRVCDMACRCVTAGLLAGDFADCAMQAREALAALGGVLDALLPLITGVMAAMGAGVTGGLMSGLAAAFTGAGLSAGRQWVMGLALGSAALELSSGLSAQLRLTRAAELMRTLCGMLVGAALVVMLGAIKVNGALGADMDGVSLRAAKYAAGNIVPVVGGEIKDTMEVLAASCLLVQSALGACGMLLVILGMARPVAALAAAYISYRACAAAAQALGGEGVVGLADGLGRTLRMLMTAVLGAAAMALMLLGALGTAARGVLAM